MNIILPPPTSWQQRCTVAHRGTVLLCYESQHKRTVPLCASMLILPYIIAFIIYLFAMKTDHANMGFLMKKMFNGAGKTTLAKLLLRLYDTDDGEILYNGVHVSEYNIHQLRRRIGVAFQEPQIYALIVRENMEMYNAADDATLCDTLIKAGLDIKLDIEVTREFDENGAMLSGEQAQKLGLARILHGEFGLLLLDEPSSALDPLAEYEMTKLIFEQSGATTIMVAHRLSTVRGADKIFLIDGGKVAESGTHAELMELDGKYAEMFTKQAENYVK